MEENIKVLFIGDPHFKIKNVEYIPLFTSRILNIVNSNKLDFIVVAGDLLDNHDRIDVEPLNLALDFVDALRRKSSTFVLVGNHDYKNNQQFLSDHHWMNALKQWDNVTIVDNITEFCPTESNAKFLFVPYVPPGKFIEAIETKISIKNLNNFKGVFAHQEFYGCKMGPIESKCGDKWDETWPIVVSGHIHDKQWSQQNIYYPGSAMQHAFGQSSENTVSLLTWSSTPKASCDPPKVLSSTKDDIMTFDYEEIDLKMPKLIIKYININDIIKPLKFKNKKFRKYKIVLQGNQEEFKSFKKSLRYKELLEEGFKISFKFKSAVFQELFTDDVLTESKKNFIDVLQEKIKSENDPDLDRIFKNFLN